jgi:hypothetical protein
MPLPNPLTAAQTVTSSGIAGDFTMSPIPVTQFQVTVIASGYITVSQRVKSWPASVVGCFMIPLSPLLLPNQVRIVTSWGPMSPVLAGCVKFGDDKRCSVGVGAARECTSDKVMGVEDIQAPSVGTCGLGLSTVTLTNEVLDNVDYKVTVPGSSAVCGAEDNGARNEKATLDAFAHSNAKTQIYVSNSAGQEFVVSSSSEIDYEGWKIFQYNGTTSDLGPYVTPTPTYAAELKGTVVDAVTAKPVAAAHVTLVAAPSSPEGFTDFVLSTATSGHGEFLFGSVPPGEWEMQVEADGYISEAQLVRSWLDAEQGCVMFVLSPLLKPNQIRLVLTYGPQLALSACLKFSNCSVGEPAAPQCAVQVDDAAEDGTEEVSAKVDVDQKHVGMCNMGLNTLTMENEGLDNVDYKVTIPGLTPDCGKEDAWSHLHHPLKVRNRMLETNAHVKVYVSNVHGQAFEVGPESTIDGEGWKIFQFNVTTDIFGPYVTPTPTFGGDLKGVVINAVTGEPIADASLELRADPSNPRWRPGWTSGPAAARKLLAKHLAGSALFPNRLLHSDQDGSFNFGNVPYGDALIAVDAPGFISIEEGVRAWALTDDGCIMIPLSPLLNEGEIRLVVTYLPSTPKLDGCLLFGDCIIDERKDHCTVGESSEHESSASSSSNVSSAAGHARRILSALSSVTSEPESSESSHAVKTSALIDLNKESISACRMGLETITMQHETLDFVNFKIAVPGFNSVCGKEALGASNPSSAKAILLKSGAQVSVYLRNSRGQQFEIGPGSVIDDEGWKIFQYNDSTIRLGPCVALDLPPRFTVYSPSVTPLCCFFCTGMARPSRRHSRRKHLRQPRPCHRRR